MTKSNIMSIYEYIISLEYINEIIPWFDYNVHEYSIKELNKWVISANLWGMTNNTYIKNGVNTLSIVDNIKEMTMKAEQDAKHKSKWDKKWTISKRAAMGARARSAGNWRMAKRMAKIQMTISQILVRSMAKTMIGKAAWRIVKWQVV